MKLKNKKIAFGLTSCFYAFKNTIAEMKNIALEGGEIIPIMPIDTYNTDSKYGKASDFIRQIEKIYDTSVLVATKSALRANKPVLLRNSCQRWT